MWLFVYYSYLQCSAAVFFPLYMPLFCKKREAVLFTNKVCKVPPASNCYAEQSPQEVSNETFTGSGSHLWPSHLGSKWPSVHGHLLILLQQDMGFNLLLSLSHVFVSPHVLCQHSHYLSLAFIPVQALGMSSSHPPTHTHHRALVSVTLG